MIEEIVTENDHGTGVVKSWASIIDDNTREQAALISRSNIVEGHLALMPDAHFGYGPPVGTALKTREGVMPYAVGGRTWLDRDAGKLLDEAPGAYKPIEQVMKDSEGLVEPVTVLSQFINYKGL